MSAKQTIIEFAKKNNKIVYTLFSYGNYKYCSNYDELETITNDSNGVCEYINADVNVNLFFDIDVKLDEGCNIMQNCKAAIQYIDNKVRKHTLLKTYIMRRIVLSSHGEYKLSYHIIYRIYNGTTEVVFDNVTSLKNLCIELCLDNIVDMAVYRDGLFRTYNSYKYNDTEKRLLVKDSSSDDFTFKESLVCYVGNNNCIIIKVNNPIPDVSALLNKKSTIKNDNNEILLIKQFIKKMYNRDIVATFNQKTHYILRLDGTYCPFLKRDHCSNGQYVVFSDKNCFMKCFDELCKDKIHKKITTCKYLPSLKSFYSNKASKVINTQDNIITSFVKTDYVILENSITNIIIFDNTIIVKTNIITCPFGTCDNDDSHKQSIEITSKGSRRICESLECTGKEYLYKVFCSLPIEIQNMVLNIKEAEQEANNHMRLIDDKTETKFDYGDVSFKAKATNACKFNIPNTEATEHTMDHNGIHTKCLNGTTITTPVDRDKISKVAEVIRAFSMDTYDIVIPEDYLNDTKLTKLYNYLLCWCTEIDLGNVFAYNETRIIYYKCKKQLYLYYDNVWNTDEDELHSIKWLHEKVTTNLLLLKKRFTEDLMETAELGNSELFCKQVQKTINTIIKIMGNRNFIKNAIKSSYSHFAKNNVDLFDNIQNIVPFLNGVYDLFKGEFVQHRKEYYLTSLLKYDYNPDVNNKEVMEFLTKILPNSAILDYVLKRCADALNGNIPNNIFLMFTGSGGNGKSLFLTLLEKTFDCLGTTLNATTLTRKEADPNSATPGLMKLKNKRFASVSESEKNGSFNTTLLKRLTGNDTIVSRELYGNEQEYTIRTKFFLACNQKPLVDASDYAMWRRIKVINFEQKFVNNPIEENEHLIDTSLLDKIGTDITWRQTMMNILIRYYKIQDMDIPKEIETYTEEYKNDNNDFENWLDSTIVETNSNTDYIELKQITMGFLQTDKTIHSRDSALYKGKVTAYIRKKYPKHDYTYKKRCIDEIQYYGWVGFTIKI